MDTSNSKPNPNDEWSDEQLEAALRRLDELHRQVCVYIEDITMLLADENPH
jgi:hypothetical protein